MWLLPALQLVCDVRVGMNMKANGTAETDMPLVKYRPNVSFQPWRQEAPCKLGGKPQKVECDLVWKVGKVGSLEKATFQARDQPRQKGRRGKHKSCPEDSEWACLAKTAGVWQRPGQAQEMSWEKNVGPAQWGSRSALPGQGQLG